MLYMLVFAANVPKIPPIFDFPYSNVIIAILGVFIGLMILAAVGFAGKGLVGVLQAFSSGGHGGVGEPMKLVGASILVIALLAGLVGFLITWVNWLGIGG
jgi:hypothetical protein